MAMSASSSRLVSEVDGFALRIYKSDGKTSNSLRLPKCWNTKCRMRCLRSSHFSLTLTYTTGFNDRHDSSFAVPDVVSARSDAPIPLNTGIYYFEVTLSNRSSDGSVAVGISTKASNLYKLPGHETSSFGLHNDGSLYHGSPNPLIKLGPRIVENDIVGCGVDFLSRSMFFTRNGIFLGKAFDGKIPVDASVRLYPTVGLQGRGTRITTNFGQRPFAYAFATHIKKERNAREDTLIKETCKEEFAGIKMRNLVSNYLIHHGYVATARSFTRWSQDSVASTRSTMTSSHNGVSNQTSVSSPCTSGTSSSKSETCLGSTEHTANNPSLSRRHSDSAYLGSGSCTSGQLPGLGSMLHRRRLRALCRRCQYGRATTTLKNLYPQVLERCPELLVQLRCRQLIEMMRRHAARRNRVRTSEASKTSESLKAPDPISAKVPRISGSSHVRSHRTHSVDEQLSLGTVGTKQAFNSTINQSASMDIDQDQVCGYQQPTFTLLGSDQQPLASSGDLSFDDDFEFSDLIEDANDDDDDDDDDDGFGIDDDTGVSVDAFFPSSNAMNNASTTDAQPPAGRSGNTMEVDSELAYHIADAGTKFNQKDSAEEVRYVLRHIQFGRSLVNLVRRVRSQTGQLSPETERLLKQSVSLLAYPSPTAENCPLRGLMDPIWRDTIASVINSAILNAHDLPSQPSLEQGLLELQRCFQNPSCTEAQTLGHFLFYHLTPNQLDNIGREMATLDARDQRLSTKRQRTSSSRSTDGSAKKSGSQRASVNGHLSDRRRSRRIRQQLTDSCKAADGWTCETEDGSSSSHDEAGTKDDDENDEDDEERCNDDTDDNDDQDDDGTDEGRGATSRRVPGRRISHCDSGPTDSTVSTDSGSGAGNTGRTHSSGLRHSDAQPTSARIHRFAYANDLSRNLRSESGQTLFTRCYPAFLLESSHPRILTTVPSTLGNFRRPPTLHRRSITTYDSSPHLSSADTGASPSSSIPPNILPSQSSRSFLSIFRPQEAEFIAAVDEALKAIFGPTMNEDEGTVCHLISTNQLNRHNRRDPPPPPPSTGGSACAP